MKRIFTEGHWSPYSGKAAEYAHRIMDNTDTVYTNKWTINPQYGFMWKLDSHGWISVMKTKRFKVAGEIRYGYVIYGLSKDGSLKEKGSDFWATPEEAKEMIKAKFRLDIPEQAISESRIRGGGKMKRKIIKERSFSSDDALIKQAMEAAIKAKQLLDDAADTIRDAVGETFLFARLDSHSMDLDDTIDDIKAVLAGQMDATDDEYVPESRKRFGNKFVKESEEETEWFDSMGDMKKHLPMDCILDCSSGGSVDDSVDYWVNELNFHAPTEKGMSYLQEYGLDDIGPEDVDKYVLWIMCGNIKDEAYEFCRGSMDYDDMETSEYPDDMDDWTEQDWDNFQSEVAICHLGM